MMKEIERGILFPQQNTEDQNFLKILNSAFDLGYRMFFYNNRIYSTYLAKETLTTIRDYESLKSNDLELFMSKAYLFSLSEISMHANSYTE